jgi:F420-dependent oxidoreductase-like protein
VGSADEPMLEAYTLLGALAARTRTAGLGTMVTGVTYRNPALLAKIVTTLDIVSGGRAILGIGAAWNDQEHAGYGFAFPSVAERMDRLEEALQICRAMFTETSPSFDGRHYSVHEALNYPRPIRRGGIPILVGGSGERRTLALVARYADACNLFGDAATVIHKLGVLDRHCEAVGRDPAEITRTKLTTLVIADTPAEAESKVGALAALRGVAPADFRSFAVVGDPDSVGEEIATYLEAGLDGMVFNLPDAHDLDAVRLAGETVSRIFS